MNKLWRSLILVAVVAPLIIGGACGKPPDVQQPSTSELECIQKAQESFQQGLMYRHQGRLPEAITEFCRAAEINPNEGIYHWYLGGCYKEQQNWDAAIASYSKAIELYANSRLMEQWHLPTAYQARGFCYSSKGEISSAIEDLTKAIEVNPKDDKEMASMLYSYRGLYYSELGLRDQAIADYRTVVQLGDPVWVEKTEKALEELEGS